MEEDRIKIWVRMGISKKYFIKQFIKRSNFLLKFILRVADYFKNTISFLYYFLFQTKNKTRVSAVSLKDISHFTCPTDHCNPWLTNLLHSLRPLVSFSPYLVRNCTRYGLSDFRSWLRTCSLGEMLKEKNGAWSRPLMVSTAGSLSFVRVILFIFFELLSLTPDMAW